MEFNKEEFLDDGDSHAKQVVNTKPNAWRVDGDDNLDENDLEGRSGDATINPVMEGKPMGGQNFGENNVTPSGDDKNNPSQNAGYSNGYFARNEPSEEHPEDTNFTRPGQEGSPDYGKAQPGQPIINELPKPEKVERGNGENDRPHKGNTYQEGTTDNDSTNSSPNEVSDQETADEEFDDDDDDDIEK